MNKAEFVSFISSEHCITKYEAKRRVEILTDSITKILSDGKTIELLGFGAFSVRHIPSRIGINPRNGKRLEIEAYNKPAFKAGKLLKDACNK